MYHYLSDEEVVKHMGLAPAQNVEDVLDEIEWYHSIITEGTGIRWGITLKDSGKVIGSCGYLNMQGKHYRAAVGFELSKNYWGKGIASEALGAIISYDLALGKAYPSSVKGGADMDDQALDQNGVNNSITHVDFMMEMQLKMSLIRLPSKTLQRMKVKGSKTAICSIFKPAGCWY